MYLSKSGVAQAVFSPGRPAKKASRTAGKCAVARRSASACAIFQHTPADFSFRALDAAAIDPLGPDAVLPPVPTYRAFQDPLKKSEAFAQLETLMRERIIFIDGAMGTQIQKWKLEEADFRGERYANHSDELKGNNDLLVITRPDVIEAIHTAYLEAGADIIETNTFNGTTISQADYSLDQKVEVDLINTTAAQLAKKCTAAYMAAHPGSRKFVAGAIGPTNKTLSVSPSVENPALRGITFDEVEAAYYEQAVAPQLRLSGLEPLNYAPNAADMRSTFLMLGERCNVAGSIIYKKAIVDGDYDKALGIALAQVNQGAHMLDINMDDGLIEGVAAMTRFVNLLVSDPEISRVPFMIDSSKFHIIEAGLKCCQVSGRW